RRSQSAAPRSSTPAVRRVRPPPPTPRSTTSTTGSSTPPTAIGSRWGFPPTTPTVCQRVWCQVSRAPARVVSTRSSPDSRSTTSRASGSTRASPSSRASARRSAASDSSEPDEVAPPWRRGSSGGVVAAALLGHFAVLDEAGHHAVDVVRLDLQLRRDLRRGDARLCLDRLEGVIGPGAAAPPASLAPARAGAGAGAGA